MAVLLYQIGILLVINIAALFGRNSRNTAVILISIFTVLQVFMSWLLILQFITIFVAYQISNLFLKKSLDNIAVKWGSHDYGLDPNNPVLLSNRASCYRYINGLTTLQDNLSYEKLSNINSHIFDHPIEIYEFTKNNRFFCTLYVYIYAKEDKMEIPKPFTKI